MGLASGSRHNIVQVPTLTPPPDEVADLLIRMTRLEWPTSEEERLGFFAALGLRDGEVVENRMLETVSRSLSTPWSSVSGVGHMFREEFLGLSLFCYDERGDDGPLAREGFAGLHEHLSAALGRPIEEWGPAREPACLWQPGPLTIDMYCFQRLSSSVMVGPSHTERSAANDAAHEQAARRE